MPASPADTLIEIGVVGRAHGIRGQVSYRPHDPESETLRPGLGVTLVSDEVFRKVTVRSVSGVGPSRRLSLDGVNDRTGAELLQGARLLVEPGDLPPLPEGEHYYHELVGLQVRDPSGAVVGELVEVYDTPAHDVYVVRLVSGEEVDVPAVSAFVPEIDVEGGFIVLSDLEAFQ